MEPDRVYLVRDTLMELKSRYPMDNSVNQDMAILIRVVMMLADEVTK